MYSHSAKSRSRPGSIELATKRIAELMVVPSWVMIIAVFALPILGALYFSFRNETLGSFVTPSFIGFDNYVSAFSNPRFWESIRVTFLLMALGLAIQLPVGIGLAVLLDRPLRAPRIFRSILIISVLLTPVAVGLMWRFMFDTDLGVINWMLDHTFLGSPNWLGARWPALFAVTIVDSWQSIPFVMLITLGSGLLTRYRTNCDRDRGGITDARERAFFRCDQGVMEMADILDRWGVKPVINASGTMTSIGVSRVLPEVSADVADVADILGKFVRIDGLQARASEISTWTKVIRPYGRAFAAGKRRWSVQGGIHSVPGIRSEYLWVPTYRTVDGGGRMDQARMERCKARPGTRAAGLVR